MKLSISTSLSADVTIPGNGILTFDQNISTGPILTLGNGYEQQVAVDGPVILDVSVGTADASLVDVAITKNGVAFRYLGTTKPITGGSPALVSGCVLDAAAVRGDKYSVQIGLATGAPPSVISSNPMYTHFEISGV